MRFCNFILFFYIYFVNTSIAIYLYKAIWIREIFNLIADILDMTNSPAFIDRRDTFVASSVNNAQLGI